MRFIFCLLIFSSALQAQRITLQDELNHFSIDRLPQFRSHTNVAQVSSYDTTGGNNDGFGGNYSFIRKNADGSLVLFDQKGPGVIERIWTPTPTEDTLDFYIDGRLAMSVSFLNLFSGKVRPFVPPLCDQAVGGYYCYFPILFQTHCRIVSRGKLLQFHQIQYRLFEKGTRVESFRKDASANVSLDVHLDGFEKIKKLSINKGGRIGGIELRSAAFLQNPDTSISIRIYWDGEKVPAIDCPITDFFGFAFGKQAMKSLLLGSDADKLYCYFPMPFDKSARIEITGSKAFDATVYYSPEKRKKDEGKFYAFRNKSMPPAGEKVMMLAREGKGHYVGTILTAEGLKKNETGFFEGDDSTAIDGAFRLHGTGSEDYFNGGWYNVKGRWDTIRCQPLSGCLGYSIQEARTGGYRFYLTDKLSFEKSIYHAMEHGPVNNIPAMYMTVGFYYCDRPPKTK